MTSNSNSDPRYALVALLYSLFGAFTFWEFTQDGHLGHLFMTPAAMFIQYAIYLQDQELTP